jgi:hypothetical protein
VIHVDAFELQDVATGRFFTIRPLHGPGPSRYIPHWTDELSGTDAFSRSKEVDLERLLADFDGVPEPDRLLWHVRIPAIMSFDWSPDDGFRRWRNVDPGVYEMVVRKVRRQACECCGANPYRFDWKPRRPIQEVEDGTWRCEKHVGRNPCAIEGCGKTRASRRPRSDYYLCGAHWKMVPHRLKLVYQRLWRLAKANARRRIGDEQGFTEQLNDRYWRNWRRIIDQTRLAVHPPALEAEVVSSGPPPAALLKELERIGL